MRTQGHLVADIFSPPSLPAPQNYGEGSAREHAALQPRFYGGCLIVARSFARIHETNLKKQGVLPLWFADKADYLKISAGDNVETVGVSDLVQGDVDAVIRLRVTKKESGEVMEIETKHTMSRDQIRWLKSGSALNLVKEVKAEEAARASA